MTGSIPVVVLFGPTAVGKTDILLSLFEGTGEVVSADSMQVYRGMDVGTAKPSPSERARLPHHLIDIRNPDEQFSAGDFVREADLRIREIYSRGRIPVVSGGTAFYFRNFLFGLAETPSSDPAVRERLQEELQRRGLSSLREELSGLDPVTASRISVNDSYRILRALEVWRCTGRPLSSFRVPDTIRPELDPLLIGLDRDRDDLYRRINLRVDAMFKRGLVDEVRRFMKAGFTGEEPGMQAIGYREFFLMRQSGCLSPGGVRELIRMYSRRYAKRQLTFFRPIERVRWFHPDDRGSIVSALETFLGERSLPGPT